VWYVSKENLWDDVQEMIKILSIEFVYGKIDQFWFFFHNLGSSFLE